MTLLDTITQPFSDCAAQRRQIKLRIINSKKEWAKIEALIGAIAATEAEIDTATHDHDAACAPIQNQLASIQSTQVDALLDRLEPDASLEVRRLELLEELDVCNEVLADVCRRCHDKISRLNGEHVKLVAAAGHTSPEALRGDLLRLGDPELLADLRFEQGTSQALVSRIAMSEALLRQAQAELVKLRAINKPDPDDKHRVEVQVNREKRNLLDLKRLGAESLMRISG